MPGMLDEFAKLHFGQDMGNVLASIGASIRENRMREEAQQMIGQEIPKIDLRAPDYKDRVTTLMMHSLDLPPELQDKVVGAFEKTVVEPYRLSQESERTTAMTKEREEMTTQRELAPIYKMIDEYRTKNGTRPKSESEAEYNEVVSAVNQGVTDPRERARVIPVIPKPVDISERAQTDVELKKFGLKLDEAKLEGLKIANQSKIDTRKFDDEYRKLKLDVAKTQQVEGYERIIDNRQSALSKVNTNLEKLGMITALMGKDTPEYSVYAGQTMNRLAEKVRIAKELAEAMNTREYLKKKQDNHYEQHFVKADKDGNIVLDDGQNSTDTQPQGNEVKTYDPSTGTLK